MVTHYKIDGHLACGTHGEKLASSKELNQVKCRNCRNTEVYKQARRDTRNAARRATRKSKVAQPRTCLLYTSPSPRDKRQSRMPSSA